MDIDASDSLRRVADAFRSHADLLNEIADDNERMKVRHVEAVIECLLSVRDAFDLLQKRLTDA